MANHSFRSAVVLVLLLGTFALAVPAVSRLVDGWFFAADASTSQKWGSGATKVEPAHVLRPANPELVPLRAEAGERPPPATKSENFAFEFRDDARYATAKHEPAVRAVSHEEEIVSPARISALQQDFNALQADYVVVEQLQADQYECRCLMPLAPESSYQKAFGATGSTAEVAMQQVLAEVRLWKRFSGDVSAQQR